MSSHKKIILCWIPSHIGVRGNERADSAAKSSLDLSLKFISIPYTDLKLTISKFLPTKWQQRWDMNIYNKLFKFSLIAHWSYKAYSLFHTETGTTTTVFDLADNLHG